ncbi:hypothetical protein SAY87_004098 [Trapa incisa]|uniref:GrpE protein homolog n=1 Tax=Trapa incisa TaxID=236973 RepID=A0AAN7PL92_9MYRT|nr:hypothetical protein SAY87_004098 [Trapa incisa]
MFSARVLYRASRGASRLGSLLSPSQNMYSPVLSRQFYIIPGDPLPKYISLFQHPNLNSSAQQQFRILSTTTREHAEMDRDDAEMLKENEGNISDHQEDMSLSGTAVKPGPESESQKTKTQKSTQRRRRRPRRVAFSDSDADEEGELSMEKLAKLVADKEELLKLKHKDIEKMQEKVNRSYAEMENVMDRTRREAENSKKYAIQSFAKSLLDVADNLGRASSVVKESFANIDVSKDTDGAVPLLKTLLEGVEMTEKQLIQAFKKFGIEKYDPTDEPFDPHRHNAVFQIPDSSKPPGTVAVVLKAGYMLHERVIRPAEVGVTPALENDLSESNAAEAD